MYTLGVDLGTTYTAAAIRRGDRTEIVDLGTRSAAIPSAVFLREDGTVLTGDAAIRRGATDPARLSREFKRRMGDSTAILLGGSPYSVDALMAAVLRSVVATVTERQGQPPASIGLAHPANWGHYKKDLLDQAVRRADLDGVTLITEPQAAAVHYSTLERLDTGAVVAVYDLGGGTFDAAVLRKTSDGFELLGQPEGIERLGGIDFDEAVFRHVLTALGGAQGDLDPDDPVAQAAVSRLREECVAAKEALSSDTETSIPVMLPNVQTEVRLTRAEFEAMIRPALGDTLVVLQRALRSAGLEPEGVHSVLLVGGSSRIPLISQMVGAEFGRPVALDVHPKHSVALGAAIIADTKAGASAAPAAPPVVTAPAGTPSSAPGTVAMAPPMVPVITAATPPPSQPVAPPAAPPSLPTAPVVRTAPPAAAPPAPPATAAPAAPTAPVPAVPAMAASPGAGAPPPPSASPAFVQPSKGKSRRTPLLVGAAVLAALGIGLGVVLASGGDESSADTTVPSSSESTLDNTVVTDPGSTIAEQTSTVEQPTTTAAPPDPCAGVTLPCIVITDVRVSEAGVVEVQWEPRNFAPDVVNGLHAHIFWNNATAAQASTDPQGEGVLWDAIDDVTHTSSELLVMDQRPPDATGVCAAVGEAPLHVVPHPEIFHCVQLPEGSF
jgi:actin-like ATPase involved in cell morphogenesis